MAAKTRVDMYIDQKTVEAISGLSLALEAGFDTKRIDKALAAATLSVARAMVGPVRKKAPRKTGRLRRAVWANPVMKGKPGAYVGIRAGTSRADTKGAFYRYIITSGVSRVPYTITPKRGKGGLAIPGIGVRSSATRKSSIPGRPFVSEAVQANLNTAERWFGEALRTIIQKGIPSRGKIRIPKVK
jgi:hypothetical protein